MDKREIAKEATTRVNAVRARVDENRAAWRDLNGLLGINKRWLRAFVSGQILRPPADRFLAIEMHLRNGARKKRGTARTRAKP